MTGPWTEDKTGRALIEGAYMPMEQHPLYRAASAKIGRDLRRFELREGTRLRATAQIMLRRAPLMGSVAILGRGPVWAPDVAPEERRAHFHALRTDLETRFRSGMITADRIAGADPMAGTGWLKSRTAATIAEIPLDGPPEALRAAFHQKWRNRLVAAEAAGLKVTHRKMPASTDHWLIRAEAAQQKAKRYAAAPSALTAAWIEAGGPGAAQIFTAQHAGQDVAAMLFLLHPPGARYQIGWSNEQGRRLSAHNLLLWRAMLWLRERGVRWLDLDILDTERTPGLARFKLGAGGRPVQLGNSWLRAPGTRLVARFQRRD